MIGKADDFIQGLLDQFLDEVELVDPDSFAAVAGRPVLFLANHQVFLESLLFCIAVTPLHRRPIVGLAKLHHHERWLGRFVDRIGGRDFIEYIDRDAPDLGGVRARLEARAARGESFLVHVEGTRRRSARRGRVQAMSSFWTDLAVDERWAVVPVRFVGGLPVEDPGHKHELPVGYGKQTIRLGPAIAPEELAAVASKERMARVRAAINGLCDNRTEQPYPPNPAFAAEVEAWRARSGGDAPTTAILMAFLERVRARRPEIFAAGHDPADPVDAFARACHVAQRAGRPVALQLPDDVVGRWLRELATLLVGPRGMEIVCRAGVPPRVLVDEDASPASLCG